MFLVTFEFEHTYIKKWCYASGADVFKSCEISNPVKHLQGSLFAKIANGYKQLTIFSKHHSCSMWF